MTKSLVAITIAILICGCELEKKSDFENVEKIVDLQGVQKLRDEGFLFYEEINPFTLSGMREIDPLNYSNYIQKRSFVGILDQDSIIVYKWFKDETVSTKTYFRNREFGYYKAEFSFREDELVDYISEFVLDSCIVEARSNEGIINYKHLREIRFEYPNKRPICYTIKNPTPKVYTDSEILFELDYTDSTIFDF